MPKVSICIPAYNQVKYLQKTIDSVLSQTFTDYEIIITDDSPGNNVKDFVAAYNLPGKIKYFKNASSLGSPENWNEAIRRSSGNYIKILHHDDWFNFNDSLAKYVALLDNNNSADFAFSATQAMGHNTKGWQHQITPIELNELKSNPLLLYTNNLIGAPSTAIFRKNTAAFFDRHLKWLVDIEFYIRQLTRNNNIVYSSELLTVTFMSEGRITDECSDNKEVEVFEYLYVLNSISKENTIYPAGAVKKCVVKAIEICDKYGIKSVKEIHACGYYGNIHNVVRRYLAFKSISETSGKIFLKLFRKF